MMRAPDRFAFLNSTGGDFSAEYHDRHQRCAGEIGTRKSVPISQAPFRLAPESLAPEKLHCTSFAGEEIGPTGSHLGNPVAPGPGGKGFYRQVQRWFHAPVTTGPVSPVRPSICGINRRQRRCERRKGETGMHPVHGAISLNSVFGIRRTPAPSSWENLTGRISTWSTPAVRALLHQDQAGCRTKPAGITFCPRA